jgi:hypothetical protein
MKETELQYKSKREQFLSLTSKQHSIGFRKWILAKFTMSILFYFDEILNEGRPPPKLFSN